MGELCHLYRTNEEHVRRRLDASVDELMPSATMLRLRRCQWPHCGDVTLRLR